MLSFHRLVSSRVSDRFYEYPMRRRRPITIIISTSSRIFGQTFFVHWGPFNPWKLDNCCEERELQPAARESPQLTTTRCSPAADSPKTFVGSRTRLHLLNQTRTKLSDLKLGWGVTPNNNINKNKILWYYFVCVSTWKCFFFKFRKKKKKSKSLFCVVGYKLQLYFCLLTLFKTPIIVAYWYLKSVCDKE